MKYRKKPIVIEAFQFHSPLKTLSAPTWFIEAMLIGNLFRFSNGNLGIRTLEGTLTVSDGDWIIQGVQGELYPCKPDIFNATYEKVD